MEDFFVGLSMSIVSLAVMVMGFRRGARVSGRGLVFVPLLFIMGLIMMVSSIMNAVPKPKPKTKTVVVYITATPDAERQGFLEKPPVPRENCINWFDVNDGHVAQHICVKGLVQSWETTDEFATVIHFPAPDTFLIVDEQYTYPDLKVGSCVEVSGMVRKVGPRHYIAIQNNLYKCGQ